MPEKYTPEIRQFIIDHYVGISSVVLTDALNEQFGTSFSIAQIKAYKQNHNLKSGLTGRFPKGHVPKNKGRKGFHAPGCEKGWFVKGAIPHSYVPVGTEITDSDGYLKIKVADPNKWRYKHRLVYEKVYGPIPVGIAIIFLDSNKTNCNPENLRAVSRGELATLNRKKLIADVPELTECGITIAKICQAKRRREKMLKQRNPKSD